MKLKLNFKFNLLPPLARFVRNHMKTVTMLEFRRDAEAIIRQVQAGEPLLLTYRGKPAIRLEPAETEAEAPKKSLLSFSGLAKKWDSSADSTQLTNEDIDRIVYDL